MPISPENLQYLLGIHPDQVAATQAALMEKPQSAEEVAYAGEEYPPSDETARPDEKNDGGAFSAPSNSRGLSVEPVTPKPSKIEKPKEEMGPPVPPELSGEKPNLDAAKPDSGSISDLMRSPIQPQSQSQADMSALKGREAKDRAELNRLQDTGSGISQFAHKHSLLGKIIRPLEIAGSVIAPNVAAMVPGTELHHNLLLQRQRNIVNQDEADETRQEQMNNRDEVTRIRQEAEEEKSQHNQAMEELKRKAQEAAEANRSITWDAKSRQFMKGGKAYTPKDFQEGAILEQQYGIKDGPYTELWLRERRNQVPQTHIHTPSAESEHYNDVKAAFKRQYGHEPQSEDDFDTFNRMLKGEHGSGKNQQTFKDTAAIDKYSNDWYARQRKAVVDEKAKVKSLSPDADDAGLQKEYERIENDYKQRAADFENQKKGWYNQVQGGRHVTVNENESGVPQATSDAAGGSGAPTSKKPEPQQGTLTPIPDKEMTTPGGRKVKIGDKNPRTGQIVKGFAKNASGETVAIY